MKKIFILFLLLFITQFGFSQTITTNNFSKPNTKISSNCTLLLTGVVTNVKNGEVIPNSFVQLFNRGELVSSVQTGDDATFSFNLKCGTRYNINARSENYTISSKIIYSSSKGEAKELSLQLYPIKEFIFKDTNKLIDVEYVSFETDGATIGTIASEQLNKVANIMKKYPEIRVSVDVHTDSKGEPEYSLNITKERADIVVNYLVEKGIEADRIESNGYGDTQLLNHCAKDVKCSEAEHRKNRRIEFVVMQ
jgi:outer membrane protein OmpA-like peptidoglycan-associated protein